MICSFLALLLLPDPATASFVTPPQNHFQHRRNAFKLFQAPPPSVQPRWWNTRDPNTLPYESTLGVLRSFHSVHGDLVIPRNFVVPASSEYPAEWHGVKLAGYVYTRDRFWSKHIAQRKDRVAQLGKLGFLWERLQPEWNLFIDALSVYKSIHGDVLVPAKFVVPRSGEWSKACWELPLGSMVQRIRIRHDYLTGDNSYERRLQLGERRPDW